MDFMVGIAVAPLLLATYGLYWLVARLMEQPT